jgi:lipopolysaccharide export LptBFGC system permease protein LptF
MITIINDILAFIAANSQALTFISAVFSSLVLPPLGKLIKKKWNERKSKVEEDKIVAEIGTEIQKKEKTAVEVLRDVMNQQTIAFDKRIQLLENSLKDTNLELEIIKKENSNLHQENNDFHEENKKLVSTIRSLKSVIIELKNLVRKLMDGVNKLLDYFKEKKIDAPWELILNTKENAILRADYEDDNP